MAATMKIKKGDTVQVLSGKDRGKQGRVIDALPREGRVIVENLNVVKRHTQAARRSATPSRMGGTQITPGGIIEQGLAASTSATSCSSARPASRPRASAST